MCLKNFQITDYSKGLPTNNQYDLIASALSIRIPPDKL